MEARWAKNQIMRNTELCFVCKLKKISSAELIFIAKDLYNLYINGQFVQYGPARAAKGYAREERVVLDGYLTKAENTVCVYVQSNYTKALCFATEKPLFAAEIRCGEEVVFTTDDFRCFEMSDKLRKVEKMSSQRGYVEVYRQQKNRQPFDMSAFLEQELIAVEMPKLLPRNVSMAKHDIAKAELFKQGKIEVDPTQVWENDFTRLLENKEKLHSYVRSECDCVLSKEILSFVFDGANPTEGYRYETYTFGRTNCGKFRIKIKVATPTTLWLAYDDILIDGHVKFNREQIIHGLKWELEKGEYLLDSNEVYTAQYLAFVIKGEAAIEEAAMIRVENPDAVEMEFSCEDKTLESIVEAARHSFQHNGYDLLTDCPSRERAGYLCDGFFAARAETFFCGKNLVEKNLLENYALYKNEVFEHDGILPMCYPSEPQAKDDFIPNWVLWYVLQLEDYLLRTNDEGFVAAQKERVLGVLDYFKSKENEYGLLEDLDGWVFVEWSKANDFVDGVNFPSNMCYYGAIRAAAKLFNDDALALKAETLKKTIIEKSFNGEFFADNALRENGVLKTTKNISETCQNYAAFFEIFTAQENPAFYERLISKLGCFHREKYYPDVHVSNMFIGYIVRLTVLLREKQYKAILAECKNRFADMADSTGTIWELFQTNASCNHGFGAVVGLMIACSLTGYMGVDEKTKTLYFSKEHENIDCQIKIPLKEGKAELSVTANERKIVAPAGYTVTIE